jgi:hypothetical protein
VYSEVRNIARAILQYRGIQSQVGAALTVGLLLILSSCSATRYLPEGEELYTGAKVTVNDSLYKEDLTKKEKKKMAGELEELTRPKPNSTFFFGLLRPGVWFYNIAGKPKGKGVRHFIREKLGEKPVLFSEVDLEKNRDLIKNRLENKGYFRPDVFFLIKNQKNRKVGLEYVVNIARPYTIQNVFWPQGDSVLLKELRATQPGTLLNPGNTYDLQVLKQERERIANALKDRGLFYFNPEFILFQVDSTLGNKKLNIHLKLKDNIPAYTTRIYVLDKIYLIPNYSLLRDSSRRKRDTTEVNGYYYVGNTKAFRPAVLIRSTFLKKGELYSNKNYQLTLNRLMNLGAFKFVNIKFDIDSVNEYLDTFKDYGRLDAYIQLTPLPRRTARAEFRLVSKSNDFAGPGLTLSLRNRNLLHGAELFTISANGSIETLIAGRNRGLTSYSYGVESQLQLPRFYVPFKVNPPTRFVPKTIIGLGFQQLSQAQYYNMNSFNFKAGYKWNETERKMHELYPINVNYLRLGRTTSRFDDLVRKNYILQRSFEQQFILGSSYIYTYNTQVDGDHKHDFYFAGTADVSGNLAYLVQSATASRKSTPDDPYTLLSKPYAQFSLISLDLRHYLHADKRNTIASRLFTGIGAAYGNSVTLPYAKQFFTGGNNSVRAFRSHGIGPGTYHNETSSRGFFVDQVGDIKLEGNVEWRADIYGVFKGAVFLDAGNVWLMKEDTARPGGKFEPGKFMSQLAVGTGFGLRIDVSYFVLRFDLGIALRKPNRAEGDRWVIDTIAPGKKEWRRDNLVLNIGIGYPF